MPTMPRLATRCGTSTNTQSALRQSIASRTSFTPQTMTASIRSCFRQAWLPLSFA